MKKQTTSIKLISASMGIVLIVERDGQERKFEWSASFPSYDMPQPYDAIMYLTQFLEDTFGQSIEQIIPTAKPRRIKAPRALTHKQFNKRVKELVP